MDTTTNSLPAALMVYFGKKDGQNNAEFLQEVKALTDQDKQYYRELLRGVGFKNL